MVRIAVIDDNEFLRGNIIDRLKDEFHFVFESGAAKELIRFLKTHSIAQQPELILMDIEMEGTNGIEATALVKEFNPAIKVIMLTVFEDEDKVLNAIKAGADGYLLKDEKKEKLIECIHDVISGGSYLSPSVANKAMKYLQKTYVPKEASPGNPLTPREQEILLLIIDGQSYQEIASGLFISMPTVKSHIYHIYEKLHVSNKIEAAKKATGNRWL